MAVSGVSLPEIGPHEGLFLIEGGVHPDVTSLFMRANPETRQQLIGTVSIFKGVVQDHELKEGQLTTTDHVRSSVAFASSPAIQAAYPKLYEDYLFMWFREELTAHSSGELERIETELAAIESGEIILSNAEKQQLSNLSDADLYQYLHSLGIGLGELSFPLLDVGTGKHAYFAQALVASFPGQRIVSTSMHLLSPNSIMSRALAEKTDRGELVAGDGIDMPFDDETFGMVVSLNADPYYVPRKDLLTSLREKHRVMKVGATALLCPAVCEYGDYDIGQEDIAALQPDIDVSLQPIPQSGHRFYDRATRQMLIINK